MITVEALESDEFLLALQAANDPLLLSQTTQVQVQLVSTAPTFSPSEDDDSSSTCSSTTTLVVLIVVAALALVSAASVLGYFIVIRPMRSNSSFGSNSPQSSPSSNNAAADNIGILEKDACVEAAVGSEPTSLSVVFEEEVVVSPTMGEVKEEITPAGVSDAVEDTHGPESQSQSLIKKFNDIATEDNTPSNTDMTAERSFLVSKKSID